VFLLLRSRVSLGRGHRYRFTQTAARLRASLKTDDVAKGFQ